MKFLYKKIKFLVRCIYVQAVFIYESTMLVILLSLPQSVNRPPNIYFVACVRFI